MIPHAEDLDIETLKTAREELYLHAKHAFRFVGLSRDEWEREPQVRRLAREHGIEHELEHISAVASQRR